MGRTQFVIRLKHVHDKTGLSPYAVAQKIAPSENTVRKYVDDEEVLSSYLPAVVVELCEFYGVSWRDSSIVDTVVEDPEEGQNKTLLALA